MPAFVATDAEDKLTAKYHLPPTKVSLPRRLLQLWGSRIYLPVTLFFLGVTVLWGPTRVVYTVIVAQYELRYYLGNKDAAMSAGMWYLIGGEDTKKTAFLKQPIEAEKWLRRSGRFTTDSLMYSFAVQVCEGAGDEKQVEYWIGRAASSKVKKCDLSVEVADRYLSRGMTIQAEKWMQRARGFSENAAIYRRIMSPSGGIQTLKPRR